MLDAPGVGNDLQDHMQVRIVMRCTQTITLNDVVASPLRSALAGVQYAALRKGPLTIAAGTSGAFFKTNPRLATPGYPDPLPAVLDRQDGREAASVFRLHARRCASCAPKAAARCGSRAPIRRVPPEIRINYLATETDRRAFIDGLKILRKILAAPALKPYWSTRSIPAPKVVSDEDLLEFCRKTGSARSIIRPRPAGWATIRWRWSISG